MPNILVWYPNSHYRFGPIFKRVSRVVHTYKAQAVEAIRISHELVGSRTDHAELFTTYVLLVRA